MERRLKKTIKRMNKCISMSLAIIVMVGTVLVSGCSQRQSDLDDSDREKVTSANEAVEEKETAGADDAEKVNTVQIILENENKNADDEETEMGEDETKEEAGKSKASIREWSKIMDIPSEMAIAEFNKSSINRSPYLCGWLDIGEDVKFTEYLIDFKADYLAYGTYFCCASMRMDLSSLEQEYDEVYMDSWLSFYAGLQMWEQGKGSGSIMSFWDISCEDKDGEISVIRAELVFPENTEANVFGNEGTGVNYLNDYEWKEGCWYRMLLQCSQSEENGHTLVEQWICDLETGEWTKMCCYDTGLTDSCFIGKPAVFLENYLSEYAGNVRTVEFKNIRIHPKDLNQWVPIKQVTMTENFDNPGSYCFGADEEQFWMITTGLEKRSIQESGKENTYRVTVCLDDSPF